MVSKAKKGNYLTIDDVRANYDYRDDTIRITSGDADVGRDFMVNLKKGTPTEIQLRDALTNAGMIRSNDLDASPSLDIIHTIIGGQSTVYDVVGAPGTGKTIFMLSIKQAAEAVGVKVIDLLVNDDVDDELAKIVHLQFLKRSIDERDIHERFILLVDYDAIAKRSKHKATVVNLVNDIVAANNRFVTFVSSSRRFQEGVKNPDVLITFKPAATDTGEFMAIADFYNQDWEEIKARLAKIRDYDYLVNSFGNVAVGRTTSIWTPPVPGLPKLDTFA
jgi:hypothetical protein